MNSDRLDILIENNRNIFSPGEIVRGHAHVRVDAPQEVVAAEASILWYTEGAGDQDSGLIFFQRLQADKGFDARSPIPFQAELPHMPWSYDGRLIKIRWAVRVRVFLQGGKETGGELKFILRPKEHLPASGPEGSRPTVVETEEYVEEEDTEAS